jgi:hypothetical protein
MRRTREVAEVYLDLEQLVNKMKTEEEEEEEKEKRKQSYRVSSILSCDYRRGLDW